MKFLAFLSAPLLASAAPGFANYHQDSTTHNERRAATITDAELETLKFYSQYAAAANCNGNVPSGSIITCDPAGVCPDVQNVSPVIAGSFGGAITDIKGYVATDPQNKLIVVAYKGSTSLRNYLADFVFYRVPCTDLAAGCEVHAGFSKANDETWDKMTSVLQQVVTSNPSYKIIFTGHSLGGAVATLAAARARHVFGYAADLYTYGSPRVGNEVFARFVIDQGQGVEYRVTHLADPVPRLPPILLGYRHVSPEYWLSTGESNTTEYTVQDVKVCEGTATIGCNAGTLAFDTDAHAYYLGHINGCAEPFEFRRKRDEQQEQEQQQQQQQKQARQEEEVPPLNVTPDMATINPPAVSDEELLARIQEFAAQDIAFAGSV